MLNELNRRFSDPNRDLMANDIFAPLPTAGYGSLRYAWLPVVFDCYFKSATQWL